ncbi:MAG: hypothetical protein HY040_15390 [Planctomycetes bacterium]|nr:hypothetical protein [Planctomycetota bacterium]
MRKSTVVNLVLLNSLLAISGCSGCDAPYNDDEKKKKDDDPAGATTTTTWHHSRPYGWPFGGYYYQPFPSSSAYGRSTYSGGTSRQSGTGVSRGGFGASAHAAS